MGPEDGYELDDSVVVVLVVGVAVVAVVVAVVVFVVIAFVVVVVVLVVVFIVLVVCAAAVEGARNEKEKEGQGGGTPGDGCGRPIDFLDMGAMEQLAWFIGLSTVPDGDASEKGWRPVRLEGEYSPEPADSCKVEE